MLKKVPNASSFQDLRPITLLNTDLKLFMKILARRIQPFIDSIIADEQMCCRNSANIVDELKVIRNLIIMAEENPDEKFGIRSLDFQKAFDSMKHDYLWKVLEIMGFPSNFIQCLAKIYATATSRILIYGEVTESFPLRKSVRQGCPMSMILFVVGLVPFLVRLRPCLFEVELGGKRYKSLAFADDVNLLLSQVDCPVRIKGVIDSFACVSGLRLNQQKSGLMSLNCSMSHTANVGLGRVFQGLGITLVKKVVGYGWFEL